MALALFRKSLFSNHNLSALSNSTTIPLYFLTSPPYSTAAASTTTFEPQPITDYLINSHHLSPDTVSKVSYALAHLKTFHKADLILSYLKDYGFSTAQLDSFLKRSPNILSANLDFTIKPKIHFLETLGISPPDIAELISSDPYILARDVDNQLAPSFLALQSFFGSVADIVKLLKVTTSFLKYNLEKTMLPNIQLFKSCGISESQIAQFMFNFPRLFLYKPETMKEYIKRVDEMGLSRESKMYLHAIRTISSMSEENWISKLKVFHGLGFTEEDILCAFRKCPQVFAASERKIKEVSDILINIEKHDSKIVVRCPDLLLCSVKHRILPRLKVMETLEAKNLVKRRPSLRTLLKLPDNQFFVRFIHPYSDVVGELYTACRGC